MLADAWRDAWLPIIIGVSVVVVGGGMVAVFRWGSRTFRLGVRAGFRDEVTEAISPQLQQIVATVDAGREQNAREHAEVIRRLTAVEAETVAHNLRLFAVEARLRELSPQQIVVQPFPPPPANPPHGGTTS